MIPYKMPEKDMPKGVCWKYALACILGITPSKIPHFYANGVKDPMTRTRNWLKKKFKKGIVFIPANQFCDFYENPTGGPDGYSIIIMDTYQENIDHAAIAKDGKFYFNPCDNHNDLKHIVGFFVIYKL